MDGCLLEVGIGSGNEGDVPELLVPCTVTLNEVGKEADVHDGEAGNAPTHGDGTLQDTVAVITDGVLGSTVVDRVGLDGGGNDGGWDVSCALRFQIRVENRWHGRK